MRTSPRPARHKRNGSHRAHLGETKMIFDRILRYGRALFLLVLSFAILSPAALAAGTHRKMLPALRLGPQEALATVQPDSSAPQYGLFSCQVGRSVGQCYDPYQMRRAYQVDSLIAAGYSGAGQTIVIVDAYQNPNLVSQVATFNAFYGLPPLVMTQ